MCSMRRPGPIRSSPPGLPAPVAVHRKQPVDLLIGGFGLSVLFVGFGLARGADLTEVDPVLFALVIGGFAVDPAGDVVPPIGRRARLVQPATHVGPDRMGSHLPLGAGQEQCQRHRHQPSVRGRRESLARDRDGGSAKRPEVAAQVAADVRRSLTLTDVGGKTLLEIDWRSRTILLGDPPPPLRQRLKRTEKPR